MHPTATDIVDHIVETARDARQYHWQRTGSDIAAFIVHHDQRHDLVAAKLVAYQPGDPDEMFGVPVFEVGSEWRCAEGPLVDLRTAGSQKPQ